jgi:hypothetical protein
MCGKKFIYNVKMLEDKMLHTVLMKLISNAAIKLQSDGINLLPALTLKLLMSYIYGAPILHVSRSHTTTQHSR